MLISGLVKDLPPEPGLFDHVHLTVKWFQRIFRSDPTERRTEGERRIRPEEFSRLTSAV